MATYPGHVVRIMNMCPPGDQSDECNVMVKMTTGLVFSCPMHDATRMMRSQGLTDV